MVVSFGKDDDGDRGNRNDENAHRVFSGVVVLVWNALYILLKT